MLFQLVLTKFFKSELFSCLPKVDHVIKSCKEPIPVMLFIPAIPVIPVIVVMLVLLVITVIPFNY